MKTEIKTGFAGAWREADAEWGQFPVYEGTETFTNRSGMRMVYVPQAEFKMGGGDWEKCPDGLPVHPVHITKPFWIADVPVTQALFQTFWEEEGEGNADTEQYRGYVLGVSYYEAAQFCVWLSKREGVQYRLPTEAEWEYTARHSRELDVDRMCDSHIREWCFDWYAPYTEEEQTDPAGPHSGAFKCVRGGYLDNPARYNEEPLELWMRCAMPPSYRHDRRDHANSFGRHFIGFRVVCGELPQVSAEDPTNRVCMGVHQETASYVHAAPNPEKPYFRKRYLFPIPPDNATNEEIRISGFSPSFRHHHHSPGFTVAPNGDLLFSVYSIYHEYDAEAGLAGARLRKGCDEWEMPDMFINPVGVNDHAPLLFTDTDGTIYHFWGWQQLSDSYPFQYMVSKDNGATWSGVKFPYFKEKAERVVRQPVNTCIHAKDGTFYMVSDASDGACSVLWRTHDGMQSWENPKGRTAGRHTTAVELKDGSILALGGKNSDIDGYMPQAITRDGGDTYTVSKTPFPALNSGQRPCVERLQSGRLIMCGDYQDKQGRQPEGVTEKGCYAAWSDDEGATWHFKKLWGTQPRKRTPYLFGGGHVLGYCVVRQSPDGMIHLVASNVNPLLHFEFNEAWLLSEDTEAPSEEELMKSQATAYVEEIRTFREYWPDGTLRVEYAGAMADDGRFLLEGEEKQYYPDGRLMSQGFFHLGKRVRSYTCYDQKGSLAWEWEYKEDGRALYRTYYSHNNKIKTVCPYVNRMADGIAQMFDEAGNVISQVTFRRGKIVEHTDLRLESPAPMGEIF